MLVHMSKSARILHDVASLAYILHSDSDVRTLDEHDDIEAAQRNCVDADRQVDGRTVTKLYHLIDGQSSVVDDGHHMYSLLERRRLQQSETPTSLSTVECPRSTDRYNETAGTDYYISEHNIYGWQLVHIL